MERLARTRAVLAQLHEQAPAQVETGKQQVQLLSDGLKRANTPFTILSFSGSLFFLHTEATGWSMPFRVFNIFLMSTFGRFHPTRCLLDLQ